MDAATDTPRGNFDRRQSMSCDDLCHAVGALEFSTLAREFNREKSSASIESDFGGDDLEPALSLMRAASKESAHQAAAHHHRRSATRSASSLSINISNPSWREQNQPDGWDDPGPLQTADGYDDTDRLIKRASAMENVSNIAAMLRAKYEQKREHVRARRNSRCKTLPTGLAGGIPIPLPTKSISFHNYKTLPERALLTLPESEDFEDLPVILFDWDDTLFPTTFLCEEVFPTFPERSMRFAPLPEHCEYQESLLVHADTIKDILMTAKALAKVGIVTLGAKPWVTDSANWYCKNSGLAELIEELNIPIYYAREYVTPRDKRACQAEEGVDLQVISKRNAMRSCLRKLNGRRWRHSNVTCVGDSTAEVDAICEIMWSVEEGTNTLKTIKFTEQPSLQTLAMQLELLADWLPKISTHARDAHIDMDATSEMEELKSMLS